MERSLPYISVHQAESWQLEVQTEKSSCGKSLAVSPVCLLVCPFMGHVLVDVWVWHVVTKWWELLVCWVREAAGEGSVVGQQCGYHVG